MRRLLVAMMIAGAATGARAADLPDLTDLPILRGPQSGALSSRSTYWQGFYLGGQYGIASTNFNGPQAAAGLASLASRTSPFASSNGNVIGSFDKTSSTAYGGFVGYNGQWEDVVLGIDGNYNVGSQNARYHMVPQTIVQSVNGNNYTVTTTGASSIAVNEYGSARVRAGWSIGSFLPYGTVGVAIGRADVSRTVLVQGSSTPGPVPFGPFTGFEQKTNAFIYGYSYGGGVDVMLIGGLFVRAEVDVTRFTTLWGMDATVTSARAGAGYKF